ncbi:MAG TPA: hypothetical protein DCG25_00195 [Acidimicrobiaceae bacterium]|nr:hypothetical protein [Acidimicrobiaceae bacterium]
MMFLLWTTLAFADDACRTIALPDIAAVPEPAIIVLGERRGAQPDLGRAKRIIRRLQKNANGPVTVATDIVHHSVQRQFDAYEAGQINHASLEQNLQWPEQTSVSFAPYGQLFKLAEQGVSVKAVGIDLVGPPNTDIRPPVPAVYPSMVNTTIADDALPFGLDGRIAEVMAYWDYQVANRAVNEWDGKGYLVILTERARVEGGGGVPWQLVQSGKRNVYSFILSWSEPFCAEGDNVWAKNPLLHTLGL